MREALVFNILDTTAEFTVDCQLQIQLRCTPLNQSINQTLTRTLNQINKQKKINLFPITVLTHTLP